MRRIQKPDNKGFKMYADREDTVPHLEIKCILTRRYEVRFIIQRFGCQAESLLFVAVDVCCWRISLVVQFTISGTY